MKEDGYLVGPDGNVAGETLQCRHCQAHWVIQRGSGKQRGFCLKCMGPTCGAPACESECVPWEKMMERMEARQVLGKELDRTRAL